MNNYEILKRLIGFNTISDKENSQLLDYISEYLKTIGFHIEYKVNDDMKKCLIAKSKDKCEIAFLGHSDTVSYSDGWHSDPFSLTEKESKLYGLGVCDMKGGIAAFLESLKNIDVKNLNKGIMIIITFDEEIGFEGVKLIKDRKDIPNIIIIGEPTDNEIIISSKGCMEFEMIFKGKAVHSSHMVLGDNAILKCMEFINELNDFSNLLKNDVNAVFETPFTTNNISIIEGGECINKVPDMCKLLFDFRTVYESHNDIILKKIEELSNKYNATFKLITNLKPFSNNDKNTIELFENITNKSVNSANFVSEGNFFTDKNILIIGPGPITAHEIDEHITVDSFNKSIEIYQKLIGYFCK